VITTPAVLSAFTTAIAAPSDSLSERFAATFVLLRRFSIAKSKFHLLQPKLLQSIIAPVAVLNLFTSAAVIVAMYLFVYILCNSNS
jgi:hypothetical protein